jgi:hypothetical protein
VARITEQAGTTMTTHEMSIADGLPLGIFIAGVQTAGAGA